jgi:hypothetical protein
MIIETSNLACEKLRTDARNLEVICNRKMIPQINRLLVENGIQVESIRVENNLEQFFLALT